MPKVGLSRPYVAIYSEDGAGRVSYSDGIRAGRAVSYSLSVESNSTNDFYADNAVAESTSGVFSRGELSLTTAELEQVVSAMILGAKFETRTVPGVGEIRVQVFNDEMQSPKVGFGIIVKNIVRGVTSWRAVVLSKVAFNIPEDSAETQGENIEWQTDTITAKVMRDDSEKHVWKLDAVFDSESKADAFICHILNIQNATIDALKVTSGAGNQDGKTEIAVTPDLTDGRSYRYKIGADLPKLYDDLSLWTEWDGVSEIAASTGDTIVIAEVDTTMLAMAAGSAQVVVKEAT